MNSSLHTVFNRPATSASVRWLHCSPVLLAMALAPLATAQADVGASALPGGGAITEGRGSISQSASRMDVHQRSARMIAEWASFDIGSKASVHFHQPGRAAFALNRVVGGNPSRIMGRLTADGQVALINGAGVLFGKNARIDVGGITASTLDINDRDFMDGDLSFSGAGAAVINQGQIHARQGGYVALVGATVNNEGEIRAPGGTAALAAGDEVRLEVSGFGLLGVRMDGATADALVDNSGVVAADDGRVILSAARSGDALSAAVNQTGRLQANRMSLNADGSISLNGGPNGDVMIAGEIEARGAGDGVSGGRIDATGARVDVTGTLDAGGEAGGGEIHVGGGWQGNDPAIAEADEVFVDGDASINADALTDGDGGTVVLWSADRTRFDGVISTRGAGDGAGGAVETSSRGVLGLGGRVDVSAESGEGGQWLLDPADLTVAEGSGADLVEDGTSYDNPEAADTVDADSISTALSLGGTTVTLLATNSITVDADISKTDGAASTLIFNAGPTGDITINAGRSVASTVGDLNIDFGLSTDTGGKVAILGDVATNGGDLNFYKTTRLASGTPVSTTVTEDSSRPAGDIHFTKDVELASSTRSVTINAEGPSAGGGFNGLGGDIRFDGSITSKTPENLDDNAPQNLTLNNQGNAISGAGVILLGDQASDSVGGTGNEGLRSLTFSSDVPVKLQASTVNIKAVTGTVISGASDLATAPKIELIETGGSGDFTFNITGGSIQGVSGYTDYIQDSFDIVGPAVDGSLRINSDRSIRIEDHAIEAATGNTLQIELNPFNAADAGGGAVILDEATLKSGGQQTGGATADIFLGGVTGTGTTENADADGFAVGFGSDAESIHDGVRITDSVVDTRGVNGDGTLTIAGRAPTTDQSGAGVRITGASTQLLSGAGSILIDGKVTQQAGSGNKDGVIIGEGGAAQVTVQATSGNIRITGDASGVGDSVTGGSQYDGLIITSGALLKSGTGDILLTGRGGGGNKTFIAQNHGIRLEDLNTRIVSTSGDIGLVGAAGGKTSDQGANSYGIYSSGQAIYVGRDADRSAASGDILFRADSMESVNDNDQRLQVSSDGQLLIEPETSTTDIEFGNAGSVPEAAGQKTLYLGENWFNGSDVGVFLPGPTVTATTIDADSQSLQIEGNAGGDFKLKVNGNTTAAIQFDGDLDVLRGNVETALDAIESGVAVTSDPDSGTLTVDLPAATSDLILGDADATGFSGITLGNSTHGGQVFVNAATTVRDDLVILLGDRDPSELAGVVINEALTIQRQPNNTEAGGTLALDLGDSNNRGGLTAKGVVTADHLLLLGDGDFVLTADNRVNQLSADLNGDLTLDNVKALTLETVDSDYVDTVAVDETAGGLAFSSGTLTASGISLTGNQQLALTVSQGDLIQKQAVEIADAGMALTGLVSLRATSGAVDQQAGIVHADTLYIEGGSGTSSLANANEINALAGDFVAGNDAGLTLSVDRSLTIDRASVTTLTADESSVIGGVTTGTVNHDGLIATGGTVVLTVDDPDVANVRADLGQTGDGPVQVEALRVNLPNGALTLENTANQIDTIAADLSTGDRDFSLRNAGAMTVGTVDSLDGIGLGSNGNLRVALEAGTLTLAQAITTSDSGDLDLRSGGDIAFAPAGPATFNSLSTGSGTTQLTAGGAITTTKAAGNGFIAIDSGGPVRLEAVTGIGTDSNRLELSSVPTLAASDGTGGIWLTRSGMDNPGDRLTVGSVAAINPDWPSTDAVTPDPLTGLTTTGDNAPITLVAAGTDADLTISNAVAAHGSGNVDLRAGGTGGVLIDSADAGVVRSASGTVQLVAGGDISTNTDSDDTADNEIETAGAVLLDAGGVIGTDARRIELSGDGLTMAATAAGSIHLRQHDGSATVGNVDGVNGATSLDGLVSTANDGSIVLSSRDGSLTIDRSIESHGTGLIDLRATGTGADVNLDSFTPGADGMLVAGSNGLVQVIAQRAITVGRETDVADPAEIQTDGSVLLEAGSTIGSETNELEIGSSSTTGSTTIAAESGGAQWLGGTNGDIVVGEVTANTSANDPDIKASDLTGLTTTADNALISLTTDGGSINVEAPVSANGSGYVNIGTSGSGDVVIDNAGGKTGGLTSDSGTVQVSSAGSLTTTSSAGATEIDTDGSVLLSTGRNIGTTTNRIELASVSTIAARTLTSGSNAAGSAIYLRKLGTDDSITVGSVGFVNVDSTLAGLTTGANAAPVTLTTAGGDLIATQAIQAHGDGNVDLRTASGQSGSIQINGGQVRSGATGTGAGTIQLVSGADITTTTTIGTVSEIATAGAVTLDADGVVGGDGKRIELAGNLDLAASATGAIWLNSTSGNVVVEEVAAIGSNTRYSDHDAVTLAGLVVDGSNAPVTLTTVDGSITLKEAVTATGTAAVDLRAGGTTAGIVIDNDTRSGLVQSGSGILQLIAEGSVTTTSASAVTPKDELSTSGAARIEAGTGIGSATNRIELAGVTTLAADGGSGAVWLRGTGTSGILTIGRVNAVNAGSPLSGLQTTGGNAGITVTTRGAALTVTQDVSTHGNGSIDLRTASAGDVAINGASLSSGATGAGTGTVQLIAGGDLTTDTDSDDATADDEILTAGPVLLDAGGVIGADGRRIEIANAGTLAARSGGTQWLRQRVGDAEVGTVAAIGTATELDNPASTLNGLATTGSGGDVGLFVADGTLTVTQDVVTDSTGLIDLRTGGSGNTMAVNDGAALKAGGGSGSGLIQLIASGGIQVDTNADATPQLSNSGDVLLTADSGAIGSGAIPLRLAGDSQLTASASGAGNGVFLRQVTGDLTISAVDAYQPTDNDVDNPAVDQADLTTESGAVVAVSVAGGLALDRDTTDAVRVDAGGGQGHVRLETKAANPLTLNAGINAGGSVSLISAGTLSQAAAVVVDSGRSSVATDGTLAVQVTGDISMAGDAVLGTHGGDILLLSDSGAIALGRIDAASTGSARVSAAGAVTDADGSGGTVNVTARGVQLAAGGAVGSAEDAITVDGTTLAAESSGGGIYIAGAGGSALDIAEVPAISVNEVESDGDLVSISSREITRLSGLTTEGDDMSVNTVNADLTLSGSISTGSNQNGVLSLGTTGATGSVIARQGMDLIGRELVVNAADDARLTLPNRPENVLGPTLFANALGAQSVSRVSGSVGGAFYFARNGDVTVDAAPGAGAADPGIRADYVWMRAAEDLALDSAIVLNSDRTVPDGAVANRGVILAAGGAFRNDTGLGAEAIASGDAGWLIYDINPRNDLGRLAGLRPTFRFFDRVYDNARPAIVMPAGNGYISTMPLRLPEVLDASVNQSDVGNMLSVGVPPMPLEPAPIDTTTMPLPSVMPGSAQGLPRTVAPGSNRNGLGAILAIPVEVNRVFTASLADVLGEARFISARLDSGAPLPEWLEVVTEGGQTVLTGRVPVGFEGPLTVLVSAGDPAAGEVGAVALRLVSLSDGMPDLSVAE